MKKIKQILTVLLLTIVLMPQQQIFAVTGGITITGPTTLKPGDTETYKIKFNSNETAYFSYNVSGTNLKISGPISSGAYGSGEKNVEEVLSKFVQDILQLRKTDQVHFKELENEKTTTNLLSVHRIFE